MEPQRSRELAFTRASPRRAGAADDRNEFARPYTQIHPIQRHDPLGAVTQDLAHPDQPQSTTLRGAGVGRGRHTVGRLAGQQLDRGGVDAAARNPYER